ncbi:MAG: hypothetical protein AAF610_07465 [Pseudomonadota bacterium]
MLRGVVLLLNEVIPADQVGINFGHTFNSYDLPGFFRHGSV